ncbi:MAG: hypothetical protein ABSA23_02240 [Anaerolineales bacterium]|jgi:hypothetical protein
MQTPRRLGTFLILVGLVLLVLYVGSVLSKDTNSSLLVISIVTLVVGLLLQPNRPASDSGRFNAIRRASANSRQRREEKTNQNPKK